MSNDDTNSDMEVQLLQQQVVALRTRLAEKEAEVKRLKDQQQESTHHRRHPSNEEEDRRMIPSEIEEPLDHDHPHSHHHPWPFKAVMAASVLCLGTAINSLCFQHVSNAAPHYFFAIAVAAPLSGFFTYGSMILIMSHWCTGQSKSQLTPSLAWRALQYSVGIGACFALTNILVDYGRSGSRAGVPDVSTVLSLILMKLVVPVSLLLESALEKRHPTRFEISGVGILMLGVVLTGLIYHHDHSSHAILPAAGASTHNLKIVCLVLASVPLSLGFYLVKVTRRNLPQITGMELWAILCLPELFFSIVLAKSSQSTNLADGLACVLMGRDDGGDGNHCAQAAVFFWLGLPFGFAYNLAIPTLIELKGSTSVPLFRALALPLATLMAMTHYDRVIHTPFSWDAVMGVVLCTLGLLTFYGKDVQQIVCGTDAVTTSDDEGYTQIPDAMEVV